MQKIKIESKKWLAMLLAVVMALGLMPAMAMTAFAAANPNTDPHPTEQELSEIGWSFSDYYLSAGAGDVSKDPSITFNGKELHVTRDFTKNGVKYEYGKGQLKTLQFRDSRRIIFWIATNGIHNLFIKASGNVASDELSAENMDRMALMYYTYYTVLGGFNYNDTEVFMPQSVNDLQIDSAGHIYCYVKPTSISGVAPAIYYLTNKGLSTTPDDSMVVVRKTVNLSSVTGAKWYTDAACKNPAGSSVSYEKGTNATLYLKTENGYAYAQTPKIPGATVTDMGNGVYKVAFTVGDNDLTFTPPAAQDSGEVAGNKFIADHMTAKNNSIITSATADNYAQILGGESDWNALTATAKDVVNKKLTAANGGKAITYPELLAAAKILKEKADADNAKAGAIAAIEKVAADKKAEIGALKNLSADRKAALKAEVDTAATTAKNNINATATTAAVNTAKDNGINAINAIGTKAVAEDLANGKTAAIDTIGKAADEAKKAIDSMANLTDAEKTALKNAIDSAAATAKGNVNKATDANGVATALKNGITAIDLVKAKAEANDKLNKAAEDAKKAIDAMENLTDAEKTAFKNDVDKAATTAKDNINKATDVNGVAKALENGKTAIDLVKAKAEANDKLNKAAEDAKKAIDAMANLTDAEKTALKNAIDSVAATAKDNVNKATDANGVATALKNGITAIDLGKAKAEANDKLNKGAEDAKKAIDEMTNLTDDDKAAFKKDIDDVAAAAKDNVNKATDTNGVAKALENGLNAIADKLDDTIAADFVKGYVTGADDAVYDEINSANADQILSGKEVWAEMTDEQKAKANAIIADANKDNENAPKSYEEFVLAAEKFVEKASDDFIDKYVSDDKGVIYKDTDANNYEQILSGKANWDKMSQAEKDAVNAKLIANGGKTYEELLAVAEATAKKASDFIDKYVSDKDGNIYKDADKNNYKQILSGKADWDKLTQTEKDAINAKLTANGGKTYEELLAAAGVLSKAASTSPSTGDNSDVWLWMILVMASLAGLVVITAKRKKEEI